MVEIPTFANSKEPSTNGSQPEIRRAKKPVVESFVFGNTFFSPDQAVHKIPDSICESVTKHKS